MTDRAGGTVVVSGCAGDLGSVCCSYLDSRGYQVVGIDRVKPSGLDRFIQADYLDIDLPDRLSSIDRAITGIVNCAGISGANEPFSVLATNYFGVRRLTEALLGHLTQGGSVINIASISDSSPNDPDFLNVGSPEQLSQWVRKVNPTGTQAYEYSKWALKQWTRQVAKWGVPMSITANCVSPGPVETRLLPEFILSMGAARISRAANLIGRHGRPDDIAPVVGFLLSDEAGWISGSDIVADGGLLASLRPDSMSQLPAASWHRPGGER